MMVADKWVKATIAFYALVYLFMYGSVLVLPEFNTLSLLDRLVLSGITFSFLFLVNFFIQTSSGGWIPKRIGWAKKNFLESFLWASVLLSPLAFSTLVMTYTSGMEMAMKRWNIGISPPYPSWLPLFGLAFWSLSGMIFFSFCQAFPYECLQKYPKRYVLPVVALLFILLYNAPLVTGEFRPDDILWLGVIFLLMYHKFRNSLSLILAYVVLFEGPVLWCFKAGWGSKVFIGLLYVRTVWCMVAALVLVLRGLKEARSPRSS